MPRHRFRAALDMHQLTLTKHRAGFDQPCGGLAEHHPTWWGRRFHPLGHPDLFTDGGVTERARADLTGDDLPRIQTDPCQQLDAVAPGNVSGKPLRLLLHAQAGQAGADGVVLQRAGAPNTAMIPSPVNLSTVPPYCCTTAAARLTSSAMISRSRSGPTVAAMSIECTTSANSTVTCLYSAAVSDSTTDEPQP